MARDLARPARGVSALSSLAPLRSAVFRALWIATIASNVTTDQVVHSISSI
ncbi:MAG TPA: hypothetical protein VKN18_01160 [Blastocatellia bacterium]|nr:hypothetical protein [Blastocatellia bacterium]